jgi:hypothetical protein
MKMNQSSIMNGEQLQATTDNVDEEDDVDDGSSIDNDDCRQKSIRVTRSRNTANTNVARSMYVTCEHKLRPKVQFIFSSTLSSTNYYVFIFVSGNSSSSREQRTNRRASIKDAITKKNSNQGFNSFLYIYINLF